MLFWLLWAGLGNSLASSVLTTEEQTWLQAHGPLRFAPDPSYPPFEYFRPDGQLAGITPDILHLIARKLGTTIQVVPYRDWPEALTSLARREADFLGTMTQNEERLQFLRFTQQYLSVPFVVFVGPELAKCRGIGDLRGRHVGVVRQHHAHLWLAQHHPEVQIQPVTNAHDGLIMTAIGQLDAMVTALPTGQYLIAQNSLSTLRPLPQELFATPKRLAVAKDNPRLLSILQKGLASVTDQERMEIASRWNASADLKSKTMPDWVWQGMLALGGGVLFFAMWNYSLRRLVVRRTQALQESERRYRSLVDAGPDAIIVPGEDRILFANPAALRLLGAPTFEALQSANLFQFILPEDQAEMRRLLVDAARAEITRKTETRIACPDRRLLNVEVTGIAVQYEGRPAVQLVMRDITERKRAEDALRQSQANLAAAQKIARLGSWESRLVSAEPNGERVLTWSDEVYRIFGYEPGQIDASSVNFFRAVPAEDQARIRQAVETAIRLRQPYQLDHRIILPDGSERIVHEQAEIQFDPTGDRPPKLVGTVQDITERVRAEVALKDQERFISAVARNSPDLINVFDPVQNRLIYSNKTLEETLGYSTEEAHAFAGEFLVRIMHPDDLSRLQAHFQALRQIPDGAVLPFEYRMKRKSGDYAWFLARDSVFRRDEQGQVRQVLSVTTDITESKRAAEKQATLEAQLRQSQKMEAIGQLAGGVAHDFNNILTVILGHSCLLMDDPGLTPETQELIRQIAEAAGRAANLTRQLLAFSRQQVMQSQQVNLNDSLANIYKMLSRLLGEHISLQCDYAADLPCVEADAGMIEQVIMNLAVNGRDAMPKGGRLRIATQAEDIGTEYVRRNAETHAGRFVTLTVTDTGCGMDRSTLGRLFEPFFTTKEIGKGTGLGLATVYGIIKQHCGWIEVASEVGRGSTFKIFLPSCAAPKTGAAPDAPASPMVGGHETILVVEDETVVRNLVRTCLLRCGYHVLEAANGVEALEVWQQHQEAIDLLLTDMVMPEGLTGRELAERLQAAKPGLKVIYTSGYSPEMIGTDPSLRPGANYLPKPYNPETLARMVREHLDRS